MCDTSMTPGPGDDVGQPVASDQLQRAQSRAGLRDRARSADRSGRDAGSPCRATRSSLDRGVASVRSDRHKAVTYGELVGGRAFSLPVESERARRKPPREWTVLGKPVPRVDLPAMATGATGIRPQRARARNGPRRGRPAARGGRGARGRGRSVRARPAGLHQGGRPQELRRRRRRKAVAGDSGGGGAEGDVEPPAAGCRARRISTSTCERSRRATRSWSTRGDVDDTALARRHGREGDVSPSVPDARLDGQFLRESPTCRPIGSTVWSSTQSAYPTRSGVATLLGVPAERVRVVFTRGSGCYGINGADTVSYDAALLSQASAGRCACSCRARTRWRGRTTGSPT